MNEKGDFVMYVAPHAEIINFDEEIFAVEGIQSIESKSAPEIPEIIP